MYEQPFNPYAANLAAVKNCLGRPKVLVLGILYILTAVLGIVNTVIINANMGKLARSIVEYMESYGVTTGDADATINQLSSTIPASTIMATAFSAIITFLFAAAFILMYVKSRDLSPESSPKSGVTIVYVFAVISLVLTILGIIGAIIGVMFFAYLFVGIADSGSSSSTSVFQALESTYGISSDVLIVALVVIGIIAVLAVVYFLFIAINRVRFYASVRNSMLSVELVNKGASPYGVACVINAVFTGLSIFNMISVLTVLSSSQASTPVAAMSVVSMLNTVVSAIMLITEAAIAFSYKKHIDNIKYGYSNGPDQGFQSGITYDTRPDVNYGNNPGSQFVDNAPRRDVDTFNQSNQEVNPYNDGFSDSAPSQRPSAPPVCPFCGAPDEGSAFCSNCGAKLR